MTQHPWVAEADSGVRVGLLIPGGRRHAQLRHRGRYLRLLPADRARQFFRETSEPVSWVASRLCARRGIEFLAHHVSIDLGPPADVKKLTLTPLHFRNPSTEELDGDVPLRKEVFDLFIEPSLY